MRKLIYLLVGLGLLGLFLGIGNVPLTVNAQLQPPETDNTIPINGTANWATTPTGPDFQGVKLIEFPAKNPTREVWEQTHLQNQRFLDSASLLDNVQVSTSGYIPGAPYFVNDFSEVMVYLDPTNPDHFLGASKFFYQPLQYLFYTGVFESLDAGLTWTELQPAGVSNYSLTSDPVTTFDEQGNGYFTLLTRGPTGLDMLKKPVGGDWQLPVVVDRTTSTDKQWIMGDQDPQATSPYAGNLYMSWTSFGGPVTGIVLSRSTDRNATWSPPISLANGDVQGSVPGVAPDGTVYVVYGRGIFYGPSDGTIEFVKSTDGGSSFTAPNVTANITAIPYTLPNSTFRTPASLPAFAVSPTNGNLYIAWADYRNGDADIYFASSTDSGSTWSVPARLNDDPIGNGMDQFQPQVSVAPNGRVAVMWFDRRLPCPDLPWIPLAHRGNENYCIDTFLSRSFDDGQTWAANIRASAQTWDWTLNLPLDGAGNGFIGDYQGIASSNEFDFPFWNATANLGNNMENYQEIFVARIPEVFYDLSPSDVQVTPVTAFPGETLTYTITLTNIGSDDDPSVSISDTIPVSTTYVEGSLSFPSGSGGFDPATGMITWSGAVGVGQSLPIQFQVDISTQVDDGQQIVDTVLINDGAGDIFTRTATTRIIISPQVLSTIPADGASDVPVSSPITIVFSEPVITGTLVITTTPDIGGWNASWNDDYSTVVITPVLGLNYGQIYTILVQVSDADGLQLEPGLVPNPWTFSTQERIIFKIMLPLVTKSP